MAYILVRLPYEQDERMEVATAHELVDFCLRAEATLLRHFGWARNPKTKEPNLEDAQAVLDASAGSKFLQPIGEVGAFDVYSLENYTGYPK